MHVARMSFLLPFLDPGADTERAFVSDLYNFRAIIQMSM